MSKEESTILKGLAILLMVYYHCFCVLENAERCDNMILICGLPLTYILSRACNPVSFFLVLSGYGLYTVESRNKEYNICKKIIKLYIHYWISLLIFVPLGIIIVGSQRYTENWITIISNVTAWHTTWNGEIWFFFPYILLALSSKRLFRLMNKMNMWLFMGGALFLTLVAMFCISRYGDVYFYHHQLPYMPVLYFNCLFAFSCGAWMAKYHIIEKFEINDYKCWILIFVLFALRCCISTSAFHTFYILAFIILFVNAPRWHWIDNFLSELGKRSTSMWFVHSYYCYYLFHDFIYGFKYPVIIFLVLLSLSYLSAVVMDYINKSIQKGIG